MSLVKIRNCEIRDSDIDPNSLIVTPRGSSTVCVQVRDPELSNLLATLQKRGFDVAETDSTKGCGDDSKGGVLVAGANGFSLYSGPVDFEAVRTSGLFATSCTLYYEEGDLAPGDITARGAESESLRSPVSGKQSNSKTKKKSAFDFRLLIISALAFFVLTTLVRLLFTSRRIAPVNAPPEQTFYFNDPTVDEMNELCAATTEFVQKKKELSTKIVDAINRKFAESSQAIIERGGDIEKPCLIQLQNDECSPAEESYCSWEATSATAKTMNDIVFDLKNATAKILNSLSQVKVECSK